MASLVDAFLTYLAYQNANKDPKVTTAPSTPGETFLLDQFKNAIGNPSPQRQQATSVASQALGNMGSFNPSNFSFVSPMMKGQQFAGGMKIPSFDMSKIKPGGFGTGGGTGAGPSDIGGTPGATTGSVTGNGPATPGGVPAAPTAGSGGVPPTSGQDIENWLANHQDGLGTLLALMGIPQSAIGSIKNYLSGHQTLPQGHPTIPDLTPAGGPPARTQLGTPANGPQQTGYDFINNQNLGLQFGGGMAGIPGYDGGGGFFGTDDTYNFKNKKT